MDAFEDLQVWKRSSALAIEVYRTFQGCRDRSLKAQITRSAISIPSNIAEGFERNSNRQFVQFLLIAKGSCGELRSQIYLCRELGVVSDEQSERLHKEALEISRMLQGLIRHCRQQQHGHDVRC